MVVFSNIVYYSIKIGQSVFVFVIHCLEDKETQIEAIVKVLEDCNINST